MISSATIDMRMVPSDPPIFPFWAWSALLHLGVVALFSVLHFNSNIEHPQAVVKVTLVDTTSSGLAEPQHREPTPATPPQTKKQTPEPPAPQAPALMNAPRQIPPVPQSTVSIPKPLATPTLATTLAQVPMPPTPVKTIQPIHRRVLQDNRATNNLNLKNLLKVAQRAPASRTTSQKIKPKLDNLLLSAALPPSVSTLPSTASEPRTSRQTKSRTLIPNVLKAMAPGTGNISKSKVGLGRTIPPIYPRIARESGWEGTVLVRVAVQPDGNPESVKVRKSSGHVVLDNAALEAVKKWKFFPAKDGNFPIRSVVEIPINFDLRKQG